MSADINAEIYKPLLIKLGALSNKYKNNLRDLNKEFFSDTRFKIYSRNHLTNDFLQGGIKNALFMPLHFLMQTGQTYLHELGHYIGLWYVKGARPDNAEILVKPFKGGLMNYSFDELPEYVNLKESADYAMRDFFDRKIDVFEYARRLESIEDQLRNMRNDIALKVTLGGPLMDLIIGLINVILIRKFKKHDLFGSAFILSFYSICENIGNIQYANTKELVNILGDQSLSDYADISNLLNVPFSNVSFLFSSLFSLLIISSVLALLSNKELNKKTVESLVLLRKSSGFKGSVQKLNNLLLSDYSANIREQILFQVFKIKEYPKFFVRVKPVNSIFSNLYSNDDLFILFSLKVLGISLIGVDEFYFLRYKSQLLNLLKKTLLKTIFDNFSDLCVEFIDVLESIPFYSNDNKEILDISELFKQACNNYVSLKYNIKFDTKSLKSNQLILDILAKKELLTAEGKRHEGEYKLLVADYTKIYSLFASLLQVIYEEIHGKLVFSSNYSFSKSYGVNINKLNKIINIMNRKINLLPKLNDYFSKKVTDRDGFSYTKGSSLSNVLHLMGVNDVNLRINLVPKIKEFSVFDFLNILTLLNDSLSVTKDGVSDYSKIISKRLISEGDFIDYKLLDHVFNNNLNYWRDCIKSQKSYLLNVEKLTKNAFNDVKKLLRDNNLSDSFSEVISSFFK